MVVFQCDGYIISDLSSNFILYSKNMMPFLIGSKKWRKIYASFAGMLDSRIFIYCPPVPHFCRILFVYSGY